MERRQVVGLGVTLVLLAGGITNSVRRKAPAAWLPIGVATTGDTVWLDLNQRADEGVNWSVRTSGAAHKTRILEVDCPTRTISTSAVPAVRELARAVVDTVCRRTRGTGRVE